MKHAINPNPTKKTIVTTGPHHRHRRWVLAFMLLALSFEPASEDRPFDICPRVRAAFSSAPWFYIGCRHGLGSVPTSETKETHSPGPPPRLWVRPMVLPVATV